MKSYVLIVTQDPIPNEDDKLKTEANLITAEDWNSMPSTARQEILTLSTHVLQTSQKEMPNSNEDFFQLLNNSIEITDAQEEIL